MVISISTGSLWAQTAPLFEDTFTSLDPSFGAPTATVQVKNGKLLLTYAANGWNRLLYQVSFFTDADISATVSCTAGDTNAANDCGIIFWAIDTNNFYEACIGTDGSATIYRQMAGRWLTPASLPVSATVKSGTGASNVLRVVNKGNKATFYINGTQMTAITGMPPAGGGLVGIYAQADTAAATWTVQDFKVLPPPQ